MLSYIFEYNWYLINDPVKFNRFLYESYTFLSVVEWFSWDQLQHTTENPTDQHGIIDFPSFMQGRLVTLNGSVVSRCDEQDCIDECNLLLQAYTLPFAPNNRLDGYNRLIFRHHTTPSIKYFVDAKIHKIPKFEKTLHIHRKRDFEIQMRCENPFIYSLEEFVETFDETNGIRDYGLPWNLPTPIIPTFTISLTNSGTYDAFLRLKINGPFQSVKIINETTGRYQQFYGVNCLAGDYIAIDSRTGYAFKNDDPAQQLDPFIINDSSWITLAPGANTLKFQFTTLNNLWWRPTVEVWYRSMFLAIP